ncbi:protein O-GlcNAcase-like [Clavelina lepadiformis]|uniref:protein O-GlcNAcase-like n=1 Tax=Clavelina lepadiformis TaxID=159417 RepID=UPI0040424C55
MTEEDKKSVLDADTHENTNTTEESMGEVKSKFKKVFKDSDERGTCGKTEVSGDEHVFMCGVVEGFYGRPWTAEQRKELFRRMKEMGLNTYLYAPKDDYKHRLFWREKYSDDEAEILRTLIREADLYSVTFVYAISPGLDMVFGSKKETSALKEKLLQVKQLGCKAFALLFDDIDPVLCAADMKEFKSSANAQASITNLMFKALDKPRFLFCPTEYCGTMAMPDVKSSLYLQTLGTNLDPQISVMWTGAKVVSNIITVNSIELLNEVLRRKVMIWDNIHANDYDPKRVFLGPFKGRSTHLIPHITGVLTNPNCEFEANFVAMHTVASWWLSSRSKKDVTNEKEEDSASETTLKDEESQVVSTSKLAVTSSKARSEDIQPANSQVDDGSLSSDSGRKSDSDSDTDSDYSSHEGCYPSMSDIEHGDYDPNAALEKALKDWLPIFSCVKYTSCKVVPRSGTPPAMPPIPVLPITTRPPVPDVCITKTVTEPILSVGKTELLQSKFPSVGRSLVAEAMKDFPPAVDENVNRNEPMKSENLAIQSDMDSVCQLATNTDVDMSNTPKDSPICRRDSDNDDKLNETEQETDDMKKSETADIEMNDINSAEVVEDKIEEKMQMEGSPKNPASQEQISMETEEIQEPSTPMQTDDVDSDVSMATAQSGSTIQIDVEEMVAASPASSQNTLKPAQTNDTKETSSFETSLYGSGDEMVTPAKQKDKIILQYEKNPVTVSDLRLLAECFFLPYEHGNVGKDMVRKFKWLKEHAIKLSRMKNKKSEEYLDKALDWSEKALAFDENCRDIQQIFNKICTCPNRALLFDIFPYLWDIKGVVTMLRSYVKWLGRIEVQPDVPSASEQEKDHTKLAKTVSAAGYGWLGPDPEPWVFRGGLSGEFQRLLPVSSSFDLFCQTLPLDPQVCTFIVRPYVPSDEKSVFEVCCSTHNDGVYSDVFSEHKQLPADRLVGALLTLSPEYCFVVEDEEGLCGYLAAALDAKKFWKKYELAYLPEMREKYEKPESNDDEMTQVERMIVELHSSEDRFSYASDDLASAYPSLMTLALYSRASNNIAKSMTVCLLSALKSHHSSGVHVIVPSDSHHYIDVYTKLGFSKISTNDDTVCNDQNVKILGRTF